MGAMGQRFFGVLTNQVLIAIPLFVLMGVMLEKSRIAEDLLETMGRLFGEHARRARRLGGAGRRAARRLDRHRRRDRRRHGD